MEPTAEERARLTQLAAVLARMRGTLRYVDYRQAEHDCELLAARLRELHTDSELRRFALRGIPRGGLIVAGMLAYALDLGRDQLALPPDSARPLLLVDDCALSGARFGEELAASAASEVVFAHLYSHPGLRREILRREPRVRHCVAARDLADHSGLIFPEAESRRAWRRRWKSRLGAERYWYGLPELLCFAWSEPDRPFWNEAAERVEEGWRFLPPHLCFANRAALGLPVTAASAPRQWRVAARVISGEFDRRLWLVDAASERVWALDGTSAEMWRALAATGSVAAAAAHLGRRLDFTAARIEGDLATFVETLAEAGLLERAPGEEGGSSSGAC